MGPDGVRAPNAAKAATKMALDALRKKGLIQAVCDTLANGQQDRASGRYRALPMGRAAFTALLEPADAVAVHDELSWCDCFCAKVFVIKAHM